MPRTPAFREAVCQIIYACSGEHDLYLETVDTVLGAVELYLGELARTALHLGKHPEKITPDALLEAMRNDEPKQAHVAMIHDKIKAAKQELKEVRK
jgi:hypothetical protein